MPTVGMLPYNTIVSDGTVRKVNDFGFSEQETKDGTYTLLLTYYPLPQSHAMLFHVRSNHFVVFSCIGVLCGEHCPVNATQGKHEHVGEQCI